MKQESTMPLRGGDSLIRKISLPILCQALLISLVALGCAENQTSSPSYISRVSVQVNKFNSKKQMWDLASEPDLLIRISIGGLVLGECGPVKDTLRADCPIRKVHALKPPTTVTVTVVDDDIRRPEQIGQATLDLKTLPSEFKMAMRTEGQIKNASVYFSASAPPPKKSHRRSILLGTFAFLSILLLIIRRRLRKKITEPITKEKPKKPEMYRCPFCNKLSSKSVINCSHCNAARE